MKKEVKKVEVNEEVKDIEATLNVNDVQMFSNKARCLFSTNEPLWNPSVWVLEWVVEK